KVRLTGKAVDTEVEGKTLAEIWPARLELLDAAAPPEKAASPPDHLDLLANDKTYLADATPEKTYVGLLRKKQGDAAGYTLLVDADDHISPWDLHLPSGHYDLLDPYAGQKLKIIGKKVMGFTPGGAAETYILPGRLEVLPAGGEKAKEIKVLAQAEWTPGPSVAADFRAIRSPRELALAHGQPDDRATDTSVQEREAQLASRMFNVESIRWNNDMVIVVSPGAQPTSGYKVEITSLNVENNVLHVHWRVIPPGPDAAVKKEPSHPAEAALTTRFDGEVVFDESPPPARPGK
ncbi:MAG TPA: protease complex subunit PrcB family protein, partial [Gemmataceae bacterium]|nr:protease complex subunit PrcB family protein [Gemmataceae bacterium]